MSKVGIFDSGVGGLTVLNGLLEKSPNNSYIYVADSKNFPYGNKSYSELLDCATRIVDFFIINEVDTIIIACNTLTSLVLPTLNDLYKNVNIIGVIESTIDKVLMYDNKNILIFATANTVNSLIYKNTIEEKSNNKVFQVATIDLAKLIEDESVLLEDKIKEYLAVYKDIDVIVLGCTHYKLAIDIIRKYSNALIISSSDEVVSSINLSNDSKSSVVIYTTGDVDDFKKKCNKQIDSDVYLLDL